MLVRTILFLCKHKRIYACQHVIIKGLDKIETRGDLKIGTQYVGFIHKGDMTFLRVRGKLVFEGDFTVGRGCRFDIGENALVTIGKNGYITANTSFIIMHGLSIGESCAISWNCQFLDDDFHTFEYDEKRNEINDPSIKIGNHVWIGCNTYIYKGSRIPDGCIVASNSVVKGIFNEENALIAGNPAKIIKRNVRWD
jgi:acetyltransferase-like isoleucine patch superfamily enzyme